MNVCVCARVRVVCDTVSARLISVKPPSEEEEDVDVARERRRVYESKAAKDLLAICDLTKVCCYVTTWWFSVFMHVFQLHQRVFNLQATFTHFYRCVT